MPFELHSDFQPTGDQPQAIAKLVTGITADKPHQTLLGVTGSGKTFTMANVIAQTQLPTLVLAHNKTLAAQLYQEFHEFFPNNAVSYFVSYYDYYQPEAYLPSSDTYIEKEAQINDEIDKLRLAATASLVTRPDVIVVASVSCIYNLGSPLEFGSNTLELIEGELIARQTLLLQLSNMQYQRSDLELKRGTFRVRGDVVQVWPAYENHPLSLETAADKLLSINWVDAVSGQLLPWHSSFRPEDATDEKTAIASAATIGRIGSRRLTLFPAKHYSVLERNRDVVYNEIERDLQLRLQELRGNGRTVEAYRLSAKVQHDLDQLRELGYVNGIENYSRYFDGRQPGDMPYTLLDYFAYNSGKFSQQKYLTFIDESHISLPQVRGMYHGDLSRKQTLIEYGFRLPSALDNRPLQFPEFQSKLDTTVYVSATPDEYELSLSQGEVVEQLVRPTGLLDPVISIRPTHNQVEDLIVEVLLRIQQGQRVLVTTLTKKIAEALTDYLNDPAKIEQLLKSARERAQQFDQDALDNPDDVAIIKAEELPIDQFAVGPIPLGLLRAGARRQVADIPITLPERLPKVAYLHSDVETLERSDILAQLRSGVWDVLVGINLLREGLDLPEVSLVAILDADKEGFLRSTTSLIQTMGRAARHIEGRAILYADNLTGSMKRAITEIQRRRAIQIAFNAEHHITPTSVAKPIRDRMIAKAEDDPMAGLSTKTMRVAQVIKLNKKESVDIGRLDIDALTLPEKKRLELKLRRVMLQCAKDMNFELAAEIRDFITQLHA